VCACVLCNCANYCTTFGVYFLGSAEADYLYGVAMVSRIDKILCLFCRISSLLQGSFATETCNFIDPTNQSHPIGHFPPKSCNVLRCVVVCCGVLHMYRYMYREWKTETRFKSSAITWLHMKQCIAVYRSVLQCVAVC